MKTTYLITILSLIAIIVLGLVILNDKKSVEPVVDTDVTATSTITIIPSPLTLASLQALPDWNPTMEVEGMVRVEDGVATLTNPDLMIEKSELIKHEDESKNKFARIPIGFTIINANSLQDLSREKCRRYLAGDTNKMFLDCTITPVEDLNELIIVSNDTGEVLHKFKLKEGYSLAEYKRSMYEGRTVTISGYIFGTNTFHKDFILPINVFKWKNWSDENPESFKTHHLNLLTGEIN